MAVLWDASRSMATRDVVDPLHPAEPPMSRHEWIEPFLTKDDWAQAANDLDVVLEPFSPSDRESVDRESAGRSSSDGSAEGTDLHAVLASTLERHKNLRGVVLLSDGDWNIGEPPARAAGQLRMSEVPVFVVGVGSESRMPDVELVRFDVPTFGVVGKPMRIPFHIESALARDYDATITLRPSSGKEVTKEVVIPAMSRVDDSILWRQE